MLLVFCIVSIIISFLMLLINAIESQSTTTIKVFTWIGVVLSVCSLVSVVRLSSDFKY